MYVAAEVGSSGGEILLSALWASRYRELAVWQIWAWAVTVDAVHSWTSTAEHCVAGSCPTAFVSWCLCGKLVFFCELNVRPGTLWKGEGGVGSRGVTLGGKGREGKGEHCEPLQLLSLVPQTSLLTRNISHTLDALPAYRTDVCRMHCCICIFYAYSDKKVTCLHLSLLLWLLADVR